MDFLDKVAEILGGEVPEGILELIADHVLIPRETITHSCKVSRTATKDLPTCERQLTLKFKLDNVTADMILESCVRSWTISAQRELRDILDTISNRESRTFDPSTFGTRTMLSPTDKARKVLANLSDEEFEAVTGQKRPSAS